MKPLLTLLLCLVVLTGRAAPRDPDDGDLVDCGPEKVAVFGDSVSPDGRYALGWTLRPASNPAPVNWATYHPNNAVEWLQAQQFETDDARADYLIFNGVIDLRAHRFITLASRSAYWPHKNRGNMSVAWSHGAQLGKFAVVSNDTRFDTVDLWLIETNDAGVHVVDLIDPAEKSVQRFLHQRYRKRGDSLALTYGDVSFKHGEATIDFEGEVPKSEDNFVAEGTVHVALPAGTITGTKEKGR